MKTVSGWLIILACVIATPEVVSELTRKDMQLSTAQHEDVKRRTIDLTRKTDSLKLQMQLDKLEVIRYKMSCKANREYLENVIPNAK